MLCGPATHAAAALNCGSSAPFSDVQFGSFDVLAGQAVTATGTASVTCTGGSPNTSYRFCANLRKGPDASGSQRYMVLSGGSNLLAFNLYQDAAHAVPFGNWIDPFLGGGLQADISTNSSGNISISNQTVIYAVVPGSQQGVPPGSYQEYMASVSTQYLYYGTLTSANIPCETGSSYLTVGFYVYATVNTNCNVGTSNTLAFGTASIVSHAATATGSISVQCTSGTPYAIGLDNGTHASGSQRRMYSAATGGYVNYGIYVDANLTQPWSAATSSTTCTNGAGTCYTAGVGSGAFQSVPVYGNVPQQPTVRAGSYSDTVTVSVYY
jgi:spore coat protein U-like protein